MIINSICCHNSLLRKILAKIKSATKASDTPLKMPCHKPDFFCDSLQRNFVTTL